jgi:nitrous oxide reductase accessory protein NosL
MMKKVILILILILNTSYANLFQSVDIDKGTYIQKGDAKYYCPNCAMSLPRYYKTNHIHNNKQYCSLHCLVEVYGENIPMDAKVVDANTLKFIDAKNAYYVIGSKARGTMTAISQYAFASKEDAKKFKKKYSGRILNYERAYYIARRNLKKDLSIIQTKKEKVLYRAGKELFIDKCAQDKELDYSNIANLKANLKKLCNTTKDKELQIASIYLWDIVRLDKSIEKQEVMEIPKDATCPICGMFVYKYPKWAAMIDGDKKLYFDGVKDLIKYYFAHKHDVELDNLYVTDYFTSTKIKAKDAYYVFASNIFGPMGNEFIPFNTEFNANAFKRDHFGKSVHSFYDIDQELLDDLEEL